MAHISGLSKGVQYIPVAGVTPGNGASDASAVTPSAAVIDGTPIRVVVLSLAAAAGLAALHMAGWRFNVTVSG